MVRARARPGRSRPRAPGSHRWAAWQAPRIDAMWNRFGGQAAMEGAAVSARPRRALTFMTPTVEHPVPFLGASVPSDGEPTPSSPLRETTRGEDASESRGRPRWNPDDGDFA